jgi:NAD(P)H dehydrogenase (quinone)
MTRSIFAVTGASGHLGRLVVLGLIARGVPASDIVALVRARGNATDLAERGVDVRVADYTQPDTLRSALAGINRLLLISGSETGHRLAQHTNVIEAARTDGVSRIVYTGILNADHTSNPLAGEHQDTERVLRRAGLGFTVLRNGWYTENYTDRLAEYIKAGEIMGAAGHGRISAAARQDYAAAAVSALLEDFDGIRTYELGGPAFDFFELAETITTVTGTKVAYHDLSAVDYITALRRSGVDEGTARFVAAIDASIARGDLYTTSRDLELLLGRPATPLAQVIAEAYRASVFSNNDRT